ncbi:MAG: hypothetical protein WA324_26005, partial [Bryobacteraceae bacterium]
MSDIADVLSSPQGARQVIQDLLDKPIDPATAIVETNGSARDAHKATERPVETKQTGHPLSLELFGKMDAYWRAANYLSVGQIYLYDNPLLKEPLKLSHVKPLVVGHWGTTPGQNFIYVHLNLVIKKYDLEMFYIAGPG